ncbi:unnamed protein product [Sphacelaria rigidula]
MELFLGDQYDFYGAWPCYTTEVREDLATSGGTVSPGLDDGLSLDSRDTARLMFVRQLWHMSAPGVFTQQFAFPIMATVVGGPLRVFNPSKLVLHFGEKRVRTQLVRFQRLFL